MDVWFKLKDKQAKYGLRLGKYWNWNKSACQIMMVWTFEKDDKDDSELLKHCLKIGTEGTMYRGRPRKTW